MKRRDLLSLAASGLALVALLALSFGLTSLNLVDFRPESPTAAFVLWALSTCVVIGTIALGFVLFRNLVKLYIERRQNKLGSRIKTKLVGGMLALSIAPISLHVIYSISLLNRNIDKWFSQTSVEVLRSAERLMKEGSEQLLVALRHQARRVASSSAAESTAREGIATDGLRELLRESGADYLAVPPAGSGGTPVEVFGDGASVPESLKSLGQQPAQDRAHGVIDGWLYATVPMPSGARPLLIGKEVPASILQEQAFMQSQVREWQQFEGARPVVWRTYAYNLALITLFMLFIAVWLAQFASRQITRPVEALVTATGELAGGHLDYRVHTPASDEFAGLVASFNSMSRALEGKTRQIEQSNLNLARANRELEERRQFIDAILESITPAVVSVNENGEILKFNESARRLAVDRPMSSLQVVTDLLDASDRPAFEHMFSTARRTGIASREFEVERRGRPMHLAVTVSSLDTGKAHYGFVVVMEDTTEIMRAQRSEAWQEVARRLAHEIKNPLTPVALAAGRIDRLLERLDLTSKPQERDAIHSRLAQSTQTINREVQSLKSLVDSFSDLARFPAVRPEPTDLNALVLDAVSVFEGRLPGIRVSVDPDPAIPPARIDPEPFKRVIVNLIDNAAEVVQNRWVKEIVVSTRGRQQDLVVELAVADSGPGISPENKRKLFLPYFSTKERGTGLGLSIVRSIVQDHKGTIRVEDNYPSGSRFIIEVPTAVGREAGVQEALV